MGRAVRRTLALMPLLLLLIVPLAPPAGADIPTPRTPHERFRVPPTSANDPNSLTVYIIPHSHCDPGWLETFQVGRRISPRACSSLHRAPHHHAFHGHLEWKGGNG